VKILLNIFTGLVIIVYPLCIYYGLSHYSVKHVGYFAIVLITIRFFGHFIANKNKIKEFVPFFFVCILSLLPAIIFNSREFLKAMPVVINLNFLILFFISLKKAPTMIERFARIKEKTLPDHAIKYCRTVTIVWCYFFIMNGSIAFWTIFQDDKIWAIYNGFISYLLIGSLFSIEFLIRLKVKRAHEKMEAEL